MELRTYPLDPLGLARPGPVDAGWARSIRQGRRTIQQVLADASQAMDEQDEREQYERDPVAYLRVQRWRGTLWGRLMGGRRWR